MATIAACRAFGIDQDALLKGLTSFSSWANNPGRANLYRLNGGHVMVDYGHNTDAFHAICRMTSNWNDRPITGIITIPGDRDDAIIDRAARAAAKGFNKVIVREDHDLRGRKTRRCCEHCLPCDSRSLAGDGVRSSARRDRSVAQGREPDAQE